jgi:hypothetical protein
MTLSASQNRSNSDGTSRPCHLAGPQPTRATMPGVAPNQIYLQNPSLGGFLPVRSRPQMGQNRTFGANSKSDRDLSDCSVLAKSCERLGR